MDISSLRREDISIIVSAFKEIGWDKPASTFEGYLHEQLNNRRIIWVAWVDDCFAGYVSFVWESKYPPFRAKHIPEIMDLNVLPPYRNRGIGNHLLELAENAARKKGLQSVGLGVGLYADYGPAQRLYVKRGYIPDGKGITYAYQPIEAGSLVSVDDDLVLWFTKKLSYSR